MYHNCNTFSNAFAEFLTGGAIPVQPRCRVIASLAVSAHSALCLYADKVCSTT